MTERSLHRSPRSAKVSSGLAVKRWFGIVTALILAWGVGCGIQSSDPTGGETHFLKLCTPGDGSCGSALNCLCGVCTLTCATEAACSDYPETQCAVPPDGSCGTAAAPRNVCEVSCGVDADCRSLSPDHRCVEGACRLGVVTIGGEGGSPSEQMPELDECEKGTTIANEVLLIGDSFFATDHQIAAFLEELARSAGVLSVGERYRDASRLTNNALALTGEGIRNQYESSASDSPVKVVIMNGGGADILLGACDVVDENCPVIVAAAQAFEELMVTMADGDVTNVVFVGYPGSDRAAVRAKMDVLLPVLEARCAASPVPCTWLDLQPVFEDHNDEYVLGDGLNPTAAGSQATAAAIWSTLEEECIAQ